MGDERGEDYNGSIAIIGMTGRFPRARNLSEFWGNLQHAVDCITNISDEELLASGIDAHLINTPEYVKRKGIVEDADLFDAYFFGINPGEAEIIDPQQRLFLECAYEVFEKAGYVPKDATGLVGVYAGCSLNSYLFNNLLANQQVIERLGAYQIMIANDKDFLSTRVSYKLNLHGPSLTIQTACSTSLVAVHMACQGLLNYDCDMALAGGVSIGFPQKSGYLYQEGMILSPDGHCRAFDAKARGIVAGEGVGVVLLKRLGDALADGDTILAVIKGSAVNNDGAVKAGYTAPSVDGQSAVIAAAHTMAGIEPETIGYVETHGTGTALGDPIEIEALTKAFRYRTDRKGFCPIGSVKTNIGHLDVAAGVVSLIKTVLALQNNQVPSSLYFESPNPHINFESSPFYVNSHLSDWNRGQHPRRAGVSSFGIGGTNAHVVLEEAPVREPLPSSKPCKLILLSAKTENSLKSTTLALTEHLKTERDTDLADIAYTLQIGRQRYGHRLMAICQSKEETISVLTGKNHGKIRTRSNEMINRPVVFMFSGQGSQYVNMGLDLYRLERVYRETIDNCSEILKPLIGCDLRQVLYPKDGTSEIAAERLGQTAITQPALFAVEYALVQLWGQWGVHPQAMIGHSIGEYVAACQSGVFTLEDALKVVAHRGRLIQSLRKGTMLAVKMAEDELIPLLDTTIAVAAVNASTMCVVSGESDAVNKLENALKNKEISCVRLKTSHAFHSRMMEPVLAEFSESISKISMKPPGTGFISNVTGTWITPEEAVSPQYWAQHIRQPVRFADGLDELMKDDSSVFLEVGPGRTLVTLAEHQRRTSRERVVLSSIRHPNEKIPDDAFLLDSLGQLWLEGVAINWKGYYQGEQRYRVVLPTYSFERQRYWIEPQQKADATPALPVDRQHCRNDTLSAWLYRPEWKRTSLPGKDIEEKQRWLIFMDQHGLGRDLAEQLFANASSVIRVFSGDGYAKTDPTTYCIEAKSELDYDRLFADLRQSIGLPQKIVFLWSFEFGKEHHSEETPNRADKYSGFNSLLFIARSLGRCTYEDKVEINIISNGLHEILGTEALNPDLAILQGPCKVIPQEYQNFSCRIIDFACARKKDVQEQKVLSKLLPELSGPDKGYDVAYRGAHRWEQHFEPIRDLEDRNEPYRVLKKGGVYLVTGGLGGLGLVFADYLATHWNAKMVLIGRSGVPEKKDWKKWLDTHDEDDRMSQKIRKLQMFESHGAEVLVIRADVCNLDQMKKAQHLANEAFGKVDGIIHAAGVAGGSLIQRTTAQIAQSVLAPKVEGAAILSALFGQDADFMFFLSSINAVLGGIGQVAYCSANAFLDALAYAKNIEVGQNRFLSINWDTWQEVGMAVDTDVPEQFRKMRKNDLENGIKSQEGIEIFTRILRSDLPHVVVSPRNLQLRQQILPEFSVSSAALEQLAEPTAVRHTRPDLPNPFVAPRNEIENEMAQIWQELLCVEQIGVTDNFFELGGHSLLGTQLISQFYKKWQIQVPLRKIFDFPTIEGLATIIEETQACHEKPDDGQTNNEDREIIEI